MSLLASQKISIKDLDRADIFTHTTDQTTDKPSVSGSTDKPKGASEFAEPLKANQSSFESTKSATSDQPAADTAEPVKSDQPADTVESVKSDQPMDNTESVKLEQPLKPVSAKRRLVANQEQNEDTSPNHFVVIKIKPEKNELLSQYFVSAQLLEGQGTLLGASGKLNKKFQYALSLDQEVCLAHLQPTQNGSEAKFRQGNQLEFKCIYKPGLAAKPGDKHRCLITTKCIDNEGKLIWQSQAEVLISIKNIPMNKENKSENKRPTTK